MGAGTAPGVPSVCSYSDFMVLDNDLTLGLAVIKCLTISFFPLNHLKKKKKKLQVFMWHRTSASFVLLKSVGGGAMSQTIQLFFLATAGWKILWSRSTYQPGDTDWSNWSLIVVPSMKQRY